MTVHDELVIAGAGLHNLRDVSLRLPRGALIVFTGPSGSGKSSLVFDTIHAEGQRQYLESLGLVTDGLRRVPVREIHGLSPSISVGQHQTNRSPRSTVGTATEVFTYLRLLYARVGVRPCPSCGGDVPPSLSEVSAVVTDDDGGEPGRARPCPTCGEPVAELSMGHLSFNKPLGACPTCTGIGEVVTADLEQLIDPTRSVRGGGVRRWDRHDIARYATVLPRAAALFDLQLDPDTPIGSLDPLARELLLSGTDSATLRARFPDAARPDAVADGRFAGVVPALLARYERAADNPAQRARLARLLHTTICPDCGGSRLNALARSIRVGGDTLVELAHRPLTELAGWITRLGHELTPAECAVARPVIDDLEARIERLLAVGVGYLSLDRASPSLSGGEAQRLRLAGLLGSGLTGVLYVLDEPTVGLHAADVDRLVGVLLRLRDLGNTVLVVEHDLDVVRAADLVVDMGPGAGPAGGTVVAVAPPDGLPASSPTGAYLTGPAAPPTPVRRSGTGAALRIRGARSHNLHDVTVDLPLARLTAVTGVSGSGKSTLIFETLGRAAYRHYHGGGQLPGAHDEIGGFAALDAVVTVDQTRIGRSPRSNAATFTGIFAHVRAAFAATDAARRGRLTPAHFSFNVPGGRCERCAGAGVVVVPMHFLPDVEVRCPACQGRRFTAAILDVRRRDLTIADVLDLSIEQALRHLDDLPPIAERLQLLVDVGVGYLPLGQPATTLSGGEAQRIKLARELARRARRTLYLLDEPTAGLHPSDTARLVTVLQRLVGHGNTVVVVEHDLDVVAAADWVIDLGPGGGIDGGRIVATGTPEDVAGTGTATGRHLARRQAPRVSTPSR